MITYKEATRLTGRSDATFRRLLKLGLIKAEKNYEHGKVKVYLDKEELLRILSQREQEIAERPPKNQHPSRGGASRDKRLEVQRETISLEDAKKLTNKSEETIRKLIRKGLIKASKRLSNNRWKTFLDKAELIRAFAQRAGNLELSGQEANDLRKMPPNPTETLAVTSQSSAESNASTSNMAELFRQQITHLKNDIVELKDANKTLLESIESLNGDFKNILGSREAVWRMITNLLEKITQ
jgi:DNA-binding transcriptional MerR regulator